MSSWVALMLVLLVQELPRLIELVKKMLERFGVLRDTQGTAEKGTLRQRRAIPSSSVDAVEASEEVAADKFDPMAAVHKMAAGAVAKVTKRLAQQFKVCAHVHAGRISQHPLAEDSPGDPPTCSPPMDPP